MVDSRITSFEQLESWKTSQDLAVFVYSLTKQFPQEEKFGITSQIKRSSSSISANIAEGFGRRTIKDKLNFYTIAYGSLLETKNFLYLAQKLKYIDNHLLEESLIKVTSCQKLINGSIKYLRS